MIADTSVLLRLVINDDPAKTAAVQALVRRPLLEREPIEVLATTVSEMVFVLRGPYIGYSRDQIAQTLRVFLSLPLRFRQEAEVSLAVDLYTSHHNDWEDCLAGAFALHTGGQILAYDRDFNRIPGLTRIEPPAVAVS